MDYYVLGKIDASLILSMTYTPTTREIAKNIDTTPGSRKMTLKNPQHRFCQSDDAESSVQARDNRAQHSDFCNSRRLDNTSAPKSDYFLPRPDRTMPVFIVNLFDQFFHGIFPNRHGANTR